MRFNKLFSTKSITNLLYGFLLLMPFCAVFGRLIYTQSNLNAKDSYYGETINNYSYKNVNISDLKIGNEYYLDIDNSYSARFDIYCTTFKNISLDIENNNITHLLFYLGPNNTRYYCELYEGNNNVGYYDLTNTTYQIYIIYNGINNYQNTNYVFNEKIYNKYSFLDNAFEYSLYTFTDDNNLGGVDFFGWFTNMFLNQSNSHNAVYLNFANWYMNYALLVSSGYLIFMALIWFINYVRRIMDKSMNHDFGGF